jgi:hypothetical protein
MKLAWAALLLALASCNRSADAPCRLGHSVDEHSYEVRGALMVFIRGNAILYDLAHHRVFGVAQFSEQPRRLLKQIDTKANANKLDAFKSTVSVAGFTYTCSRCGEHMVVVNSMAASDPTKFTRQDFEALQNQKRSWFSGTPAPSPECEPLMS